MGLAKENWLSRTMEQLWPLPDQCLSYLTILLRFPRDSLLLRNFTSPAYKGKSDAWRPDLSRKIGSVRSLLPNSSVNAALRVSVFFKVWLLTLTDIFRKG